MESQKAEPGVRILYIGAERVGLACLKRLVAMGDCPAAIVTAHDDLRPTIADFESFDGFVGSLGVPFIKVKRSRSPVVIDQIRALRPDLIIVVSWSQIIPK